jgi:DNA-binding XRE family transcriptional regulator
MSARPVSVWFEMPPSQTVDLALAFAIRSQRQVRDSTQEEAAHAAGVTVGTYGQIERGRVNPTWTTVKSIAQALDVKVSELAAHAEEVEHAMRGETP